MEKIYTCVGCLKAFKVKSDPMHSESKQHEVEKNVECPHDKFGKAAKHSNSSELHGTK
jgi:hypothetical protein